MDKDMKDIVRLQRDAALQRLSRLFSWPEFSDERRCFHQEFVYDVIVFAATCGLPWSDVARTAVTAKTIFPQLDGPDAHKVWSLLRDALSECLPNLSPVHRHKISRFLAHTCLSRHRLFQAVVAAAANMSDTRLHLQVQLPSTPCPLAQGTELHEWERQHQQAQLTSTIRHREEELRRLRAGSRVSVGDIPEDVHLDKEGVVEVVRAAVRATEGQMLESLNHEASLLTDILQLKLQHAAVATRRLHSPVAANAGHFSLHPETSARTKSKTGGQ